MKFNKWTLGLAAVGVVSLTSAARADESKINQVETALSNTTISGYVDVAAQFTPNGNGYTPNYYYYQPGNSINLNVVDITIDKPLDESPWASGYHVDFFVGPVANEMGLYNGIRQAYIALRTPVGNGIDWKLGVFDTIVGYESTTSANNPNYSKSYGYNMEPTTHTGILGAYKIADFVSVQAGIADTSYLGNGAYTASFNNTLYYPTWLGSATFTAPDSFGWAKGATLTAATIISANVVGGVNYPPDHPNGHAGRTYYAGVTLPTPIAALKFGAAFDYLTASDISQNAWNAGVYGTYQFNDKLSLNLRAEYYNGKALNAAGAYNQNDGTGYYDYYGYGTFVSQPQQAQELTVTVQYALWANVLTRLEFRWDHVNHGNGYSNGETTYGGSSGYYYNEGGLRQDAFLLAAQAIYTF